MSVTLKSPAVYLTSDGKPLRTLDELKAYILRPKMTDLPSEIMSLVVKYLDHWSLLNFGLTCKGVFDLCFVHTTPKKILLSTNFTQIVRWASKSTTLETHIKSSLHLRSLPLDSKYELFPHQIDSLSFMRRRESKPHYGIRGGIIQLKMGMGKSLVALTHILTSPRPSCKEKHGKKGFPSLVIASKTVMKEWKNEGITKFFGDRIKVLYLHKDYLKPKEYSNLSRRKIVKFDIVITTYDVVRNVGSRRSFIEDVLEMDRYGRVTAVLSKTRQQADKPAIRGPGVIFGTPWQMVVADESQTFANPKTKTYITMMAVYGHSKWCLTGTPIRNYCFTGDTRVVTNLGNLTISHLYRLHENNSIDLKELRIISYNLKTDRFEYKPLQGAWKLHSENGLVTVVMGRKKMKCTPDHKILVAKPDAITKPQYVEAQHLQKGDYVVYYDDGKSRSTTIQILSKDQEQIVIGSLLGDGSLRVLDYYRTELIVEHGDKQKGYADWKASMFGVSTTSRNQNVPGYTHTQIHTFCTRSFYFPYEGLEGKKTNIPQAIIDKVDDLALLIWYLDDGAINEAGNWIELATCSFDEDTNKRLVAKLNDMGIESSVKSKYNKKQDKRYPVITLTVKGVRTLISRLLKFDVPECMRYKIYCRPLLQQIEDEAKSPISDIYWNKYNIPLENRCEGMVVREHTHGEKIGIFKWAFCEGCQKWTYLNLRSDNNTYRCVTGCRRSTRSTHTTFVISNKEVMLDIEPPKNYCLHPVTDVIFNKNIQTSVYDIQVADNHNFVIGSVNNKIRYGPVVSNCTDIWTQLRFCGYIGSKTKHDWFKDGKKYMTSHELRKTIFRMDYKDANIKLPPKNEVDVKIKLDGMEREVYDYTHSVGVRIFEGMMAQKFDCSQILAIFTRMRQCCIAPYLVTDEAKRGLKKKGTTNYDLKEVYKGKYAIWVANRKGKSGIQSQKITTILRILQKIPQNEKALVFSTFTSSLDLIGHACSKENYHYLQIDGSTAGEERESILKTFKTDPKVRALFLSYKIGAEGLNLTQATHIICVEPWWNKAVHDQAVSRAWRYGQTKTVNIYNILVEDSIEEKMINMCNSKENMAKEYLDGSQSGRLDMHTLGQILGVF